MYQLAVQLLYQTWSLVYRTLRTPKPNVVKVNCLGFFYFKWQKGNFSSVPYELRRRLLGLECNYVCGTAAICPILLPSIPFEVVVSRIVQFVVLTAV
jgi:hypothetical protein